jgi:ABC-type nickel/cobalt efflux system permease component RcnA
MSNSLWAALPLAFALGLKHALEVDHVVAVSALVTRGGSSWKRALTGALWALGHTATLFFAGLLLVVGGWHIPESWTPWCEGAVAALLIFLGARALWDWLSGRGHLCVHEHDGHRHAHFHRFEEHACEDDAHNAHKREGFGEPFWVGAIHGLGGSGAMLLLIVSTVQQPSHALAYIAAFGVGLVISMFVMTAVVSRLLGMASKNGEQKIARGAAALAGAASLGLGIFLGASLGAEVLKF